MAKQQTSRWQSIKGRIKHFDYRMSIRTKLTLILIVIPLAIMPFVSISLYYNNKIYNTIQSMSRYSEITRICETISFLNLKIDGNLKNYIGFRDSSYVKEVRNDLATLKEFAIDGSKFGYAEDFLGIVSNIERFEVLLDSLKNVVSHEEIPHKRIIKALENYKKEYNDLVSKILLARSNTQKDSLMQELKMLSQSFDVSKIVSQKVRNPNETKTVQQLNSRKKNIDSQNAKILKTAKQHIKEFKEIGEKYASRGERNILVVLILTFVFVIYLIIVLPERIVVPIKRLSSFVKRIEKGELNVAIKGFPKDEIGELVRNITRMLIQIRKIDSLKTQKIHESERKFRFLTKTIQEGVVILNDELRILMINEPALRLIGKKPDTTIEEKSISSISVLNKLEKKLSKLFTSGEKIEDFTIKGKDGLYYNVKVWPIRDASGAPSGVLLLFYLQKKA
ncbi:MAG: hypothetical protein B5M53_10435 [Candidatus Cloacimonas sp. 4484_209]|nr:MAG: hypothetical protein B5M53_10435 [Candidatus Cloacimonas sp. 4484_209]